MKHSWKLKKDDEILGTITESSFDMPSIYCEFIAEPSFAKYQIFFEKELNLLNSDRMTEWEQVYSEIDALGLILEPNNLESNQITEFILHIDGNQAWFRS